MKTIAITGCAGFVGSWIADKAIQAGYNVIGLDSLVSGVNYTPKGVNFHQIDVNDNIQSILKDADAIIHTAAYAEIWNNWKDKSERDKLFSANEIATRSVLEQMPDVPIIYLSSASVYGSMSNNKILNRPLKEEDIDTAAVESIYSAAKLACEAYVAAWSHKRKTSWHTLRLVNQIGPRIHRGVLIDFLRMAREKKHIHAADNGKQKKNWVSVEDTSDLIIRLLDTTNKVPSGIYSVSSEERWSWHGFVDIMKKMHQEKYPNTNDPFGLSYEDRAGGSIGDPINLYVSDAKLKPYYSCNRPIEEAVRKTLSSLGWPE